MVTDVLDYIEDYENVRAVCGLNKQELPDTTLALAFCRNKLSLAFARTEGIYPPSTESEDLQTVFDRLDSTNEMQIVIQQYAIYIIADAVLDSVGLSAYKTMADGKSTITRFSAESTYEETRKAIKQNLSESRTSIAALFDEAEDALEYFTVVTPDVDLVEGEDD